MKKQILAKPINTTPRPLRTLEDVPDIDNRRLELDTVLNWIDELVEVQHDEENHGDQ